MHVPRTDGSGLPPTIGGKYRPIRLIGQGGMGSVYEVEHVHTGQRLALKVLSTSLWLTGDTLERFRNEARAAARIQSDHVVRMTDAGIADELSRAPFLVMELLDGADLDAVTHGVPAPPVEVVEWLRQVARGLSKAHALGIIHRDLKPENLFLTKRDDGAPLVKILDFGVAKVIAEQAAQTRSGEIVGTPLYMAPEQAASTGGAVSPRTDGFALGLIAFKLLVGTHYWKSGTLVQIVSQVALEPMVPASERGGHLGPRFDEWFATACDRDPEKRFVGPVEQIEALAAVFGIERTVTPTLATDARLAGAARSIENDATLAASASVSGGRRTPASAKRWPVVLALLGVAAATAWIVHGVQPPAREAAPSASAPANVGALSSASAAPPSASSVGAAVPAAPTAASPSSAPIENVDGGSRRSAGSRGAAPPASSTSRPAAPRDPLEDQN